MGVYTGCAEGNYDEVRRLQGTAARGRGALTQSSQVGINILAVLEEEPAVYRQCNAGRRVCLGDNLWSMNFVMLRPRFHEVVLSHPKTGERLAI